MRFLDLSAGKRNIWFDRLYPDAIYVDIRPQMLPNVVCDTTQLPFADQTFDHIVFDPPHMVHGPNSKMAQYYSSLSGEEIKTLIMGTGIEAYRVAKEGTLMSFKWNDHDVRLDHTLPLLEGWEPLFGHDFKRKKTQKSTSYWVLLRKRAGKYQNTDHLSRILALSDKEVG